MAAAAHVDQVGSKFVTDQLSKNMAQSEFVAVKFHSSTFGPAISYTHQKRVAGLVFAMEMIVDSMFYVRDPLLYWL
jgi:hypothetical protein